MDVVSIVFSPPPKATVTTTVLWSGVPMWLARPYAKLWQAYYRATKQRASVDIEFMGGLIEHYPSP